MTQQGKVTKTKKVQIQQDSGCDCEETLEREQRAATNWRRGQDTGGINAGLMGSDETQVQQTIRDQVHTDQEREGQTGTWNQGGGIAK